MKLSKGMQLGAMLAAMLLVSMVFVPAVSAQGANEQKITGVVFTPEELKNLHSKYNITENDIKFAENKLPNFLEGTILYGNTIVVATETGKLPEGFKEGVDYDKVISIEEAIAIEENARQGYMKKYNVDPANPKVEIINGQPLPKEEVKKLVKSGKMNLKETKNAEPLMGTLSTTTGPHAINGIIDVIINVAKDTAHKPTEPITADTSAALSRFNTQFGVTMNQQVWFWNYWDASDVSPATDSGLVLDDLRDDTGWMRTQPNDIVLGWAHDIDRNGRAYEDDFSALASDTRVGDVDWPHDSIVQHEISHQFEAPEGGTWPNEHNWQECIMNYYYAYMGTDIWCPTDWNIVNANIWGS
jgi:hypothetical protein